MAQVDVVLNIFAKPYQTALALLTLIKYSGQHIGCIYPQFEPAGSRYDAVPPYAIAEYLREQGRQIDVFQPSIWVECEPVNEERLQDTEYRLAMRYQYAFEKTDKKYLFFLHNDQFFKRDIIGALLDAIDGAFAAGKIGQCWNCPASNAEVMQAAGFGSAPCTPETYADFQPDFEGLERLYATALAMKVFVRPYCEGLAPHYSEQAWPLPECRVNEWGCLVDIEQTRKLTMPFGPVLPFGAFEYCGGGTPLDTAVAWFRELSRLGFRARHVDIDKFIHHFGGSSRMTKASHKQAELEAEALLLKIFPDFVSWCRQKRNGLFV